jgi:hypothetical protein
MSPALCDGFIARANSLALLQDGGDCSDDRDFKAIENPGYPERDQHQQVETTPGKPIESSRNQS